jgi:hypothetical protein
LEPTRLTEPEAKPASQFCVSSVFRDMAFPPGKFWAIKGSKKVELTLL